MLLGLLPDVEVVGTAADGEEAVALAASTQPRQPPAGQSWRARPGPGGQRGLPARFDHRPATPVTGTVTWRGNGQNMSKLLWLSPGRTFTMGELSFFSATGQRATPEGWLLLIVNIFVTLSMS
jgi:hypothetical protein